MSKKKEPMFDWRDPTITDWKKCLRIKLTHKFGYPRVRGMSAEESAKLMLEFHRDKLDKDEIKFLEGLLK